MIRSPKCAPTSHMTQCKSVCRRVCIPSESRTRCRTDPHMSEKNIKFFFNTICELINEMKNTWLSTWWQCCWGVCARSPHSLTYSVTQFGLRRMEHWSRGHFDKCCRQRCKTWRKNGRKEELEKWLYGWTIYAPCNNCLLVMIWSTIKSRGIIWPNKENAQDFKYWVFLCLGAG